MTGRSMEEAWENRKTANDPKYRSEWEEGWKDAEQGNFHNVPPYNGGVKRRAFESGKSTFMQEHADKVVAQRRKVRWT